jgi:hypothetical protein
MRYYIIPHNSMICIKERRGGEIKREGDVR